jgi:tetrahydromethanopterin S-methyltransferase subunit A
VALWGSADIGCGDGGVTNMAAWWLTWPDLKVALLCANEVIGELWGATTVTVWHNGVRTMAEATTVLRRGLGSSDPGARVGYRANQPCG